MSEPDSSLSLGSHDRTDERTPLLQGKLAQHDTARDAIENLHGENAILADAAVSGLDVGSQTTDLIKTRSYSSSHCRVPGVAEERNDCLDPSQKQVDGSLYMSGVSKARFWVIFSTILMVYFIACFDSTLMASSHPVITSYFHASNSASWLSTAFLLTATAFQPLFGRVSDTIGRRPLYVFALMIFATTTAWCATAQSIGSFIAARAVCGLGAGGCLAMGPIITNDLVPIEIRGNFQAYINLFFGLGSACGAAFGGFLCDTLGWRWTFGIQLPVILITLLVAWFYTPASLGPHLAKNSDKSVLQTIKEFDLIGSFLLPASVGFLILALSLGGNIYSWSHPIVIISLIAACIMGALLILVEKRAARPVMPLAVLSTRPRANIIFSNFFSTIGINAILFNAPLYFQAVKLDSASMSGFRLAAPSLALTVCGVSSGFIMTWSGRMKSLLVLGAFSMLAGSICLFSMWSTIPTWLATVFLIPTSVGQGFTFPASSIAVLATSTQEEQAVTTSTLTLWRSIGIVLGVAISSLIVQNGLVAYLDQLVTGPDKAEIILRVRKTVHAIVELSPEHQAEVIDAYEQALRLAFGSAIVVCVIVVALLVPIKLPRLGKR